MDEPQRRSEAKPGNLLPAERMLARKIVVTGLPNTAAVGPFTTIIYLQGDERRAVERFVDENEGALSGIDFTTPNRQQTLLRNSLSTDIYELLLERLGHRTVRTYASVVVEDRPDGTTWLYDREFYAGIDRRYHVNSGYVARLPAETSLDDLYERTAPTIRKRDLREHGVEGCLDLLLRFYLDCGLYDCEQATARTLRCRG